MFRIAALTGLILLAGCGKGDVTVDNAQVLGKPAAVPEAPAAPRSVEFRAPDGVTVYGTYYPAPGGHPKAVILLFHQAGSSKGEYAGIAPRLVRAGYAALAVDQRAGGAMYGPNRTAEHLPEGKDGRDYLSALPDMEAALGWAKQRNAPIILWGSSYSASLVFLLAASAQDSVAGVIAFSPGEYFNDRMMVEKAAAKVRVPVFVDSASTEGEIAEAKAIVMATQSTDREQFVPKIGIHGSSTLNATKNPGGAAENWRAVLSFLNRVAP